MILFKMKKFINLCFMRFDIINKLMIYNRILDVTLMNDNTDFVLSLKINIIIDMQS